MLISRHYNKAYHLTGPELLSGEDMAKIASQALDRDVKFINVTPMGCKRLMMDSGLEEWLADGFVEWFDQIADGKFDFDTHELLTSMTGTKSTTLYHFFRENREKFSAEEEEKGKERKEERKEGAAKIQAVEEVKPSKREYGREYREERREERHEERPTTEFDRQTVLNELERTKDLMQRWIFQQESLMNYLSDIKSREDIRLRQMIEFREEVVDALWDARQHRRQ
jgi:hypothetical protein